MFSTSWHRWKVLAVAIIATALAFLPLMGGVSANASPAGMSHELGCSNAGAVANGHAFYMGHTDIRNVGHCDQAPIQKVACCLGTSCPTVQLVELISIAIPLPGIASRIRPIPFATVGWGLHPAPALRPPRQFI